MQIVGDASENIYNCSRITYTTVAMTQTTVYSTNTTEYWHSGYGVDRFEYFSVKQQ